MDERLSNALDFSDLDEVMELVERFKDLPEFGMQDEIDRVAQKIKAAHAVEEAARQARKVAREQAHRLLRLAKRRWTAKEIEKATGYKP